MPMNSGIENNESFIQRMKESFVPKANITHRIYLLLGLIGFVIVFGVWCLLTYGGFVDHVFFFFDAIGHYPGG
ncbi:hypothetical protein QS257_12295 [Terrilactibacillus sp. S3-3]|nr:hypothetical protein QS257_12295 [Terrilactibacillus sp. S3-3]